MFGLHTAIEKAQRIEACIATSTVIKSDKRTSITYCNFPPQRLWLHVKQSGCNSQGGRLYISLEIMVQLVEQLPSRYHCASGCRLARLGLRVMVAFRVADPPSEEKTGPNLSTKVMLILVYSILGSMAAKAAEREKKKKKIKMVRKCCVFGWL